MVIVHNAFYQSSLLAKVTGITHGYSVRSQGDMRSENNRESFVRLLGLPSHSLVRPEQIHGNVVADVQEETRDLWGGTDGLFMQKTGQTPMQRPLGVIVADCVPLLFCNKKGTVVAVAHAGWKGTLGAIAKNVVDQFRASGVKPSDILVSVGPHIGKCCYTVSEDRARQFLSLYKNDSRVASNTNGTWSLDIGYVNILQLRGSGIPKNNIDEDSRCTMDHPDELYSYRGDSKESFGEILGVIGMN